MKDKIILIDGSRKLDVGVPMSVLQDLSQLRGLDFEAFCEPNLIDEFVRYAYNLKRNQVDATILVNLMNQHYFSAGEYEAGKLIILDQDIYTKPLNFCFGVHSPVQESLGYTVFSTNRTKNENHAKDIIAHELGHVFGAPSLGRTNTYKQLGNHCSNRLCVMQQKMSVLESIKYADLRARKNAPTYCGQCMEDIIQSDPYSK